MRKSDASTIGSLVKFLRVVILFRKVSYRSGHNSNALGNGCANAVTV